MSDTSKTALGLKNVEIIEPFSEFFELKEIPAEEVIIKDVVDNTIENLAVLLEEKCVRKINATKEDVPVGSLKSTNDTFQMLEVKENHNLGNSIILQQNEDGNIQSLTENLSSAHQINLPANDIQLAVGESKEIPFELYDVKNDNFLMTKNGLLPPELVGFSNEDNSSQKSFSEGSTITQNIGDMHQTNLFNAAPLSETSEELLASEQFKDDSSINSEFTLVAFDEPKSVYESNTISSVNFPGEYVVEVQTAEQDSEAKSIILATNQEKVHLDNDDKTTKSINLATDQEKVHLDNDDKTTKSINLATDQEKVHLDNDDKTTKSINLATDQEKVHLDNDDKTTKSIILATDQEKVYLDNDDKTTTVEMEEDKSSTVFNESSRSQVSNVSSGVLIGQLLLILFEHFL